MSRIQTPLDGRRVPANGVHDAAMLRIRNIGPDPLGVTALTVTGSVRSWPRRRRCRRRCRHGGQLDVQVRFIAQSVGAAGGIWNGTLTIGSDDIDEPTTAVELVRLLAEHLRGRPGARHASEIARVFGYGTAITRPRSAAQPERPGHGRRRRGPVARTGCARTPVEPVTVRQLAAYHTQGNTATFFWHVKGSNTTPTCRHPPRRRRAVRPAAHQRLATTLPAAARSRRPARLRHQDRPRVERPDQEQPASPTSSGGCARRRAATTSGSGRCATGPASSSRTPGWCPWTTPASTTTTTTTSTWSPT